MLFEKVWENQSNASAVLIHLHMQTIYNMYAVYVNAKVKETAKLLFTFVIPVCFY